NSEADIERCMSLSRDEDKVHLANAHKVKGLEAPVVIMIDGKTKAPSPSLRVERDNKSCYIFDIKKNGLFPVLSSIGYEDKKQEEKAAEDAERDRLLYVAATRARNVLIINDVLTPSGKTASSAWSKAVRYIKDDICDLLKDKKACLPVKETVYAEYLGDGELLSKDASLNESYSIARPSKEVENRFHEDHIISGKKDAALIGTLAHRLMEVLVLSGNKIGLDEAVKGIIEEYCDDDTYKDLLYKLGSAVRNGGFKQEGEVCQDILNELLNAEEVYCEAPFSYMDGNELWNGIIDVLYKKDGKWYIIDYKTNADPSDLDEKYKAQLEAYRKAFKENTGLDAEALIYHLEI
ncbi:MAG: PD-(D/E)XK nuclease family protein, partial [Erysipelotrichaceae bacterium]|nr:PD-(D/E)XK nuclease family protein [Erysipelotrichaceae bacterium]